MSKKKKNKKAQATTAPEQATLTATAKGDGTKSRRPKSVVVEWERYIGKGELEDWQRLMTDLGFAEEFPSKTQCRKASKQTHALSIPCQYSHANGVAQALETVWVNIHDFLHAVEKGEPVHRFQNQSDLAKYTRKKCRYYPKKAIGKESPLRQLLAYIFK
jgi:hypothetical protein